MRPFSQKTAPFHTGVVSAILLLLLEALYFIVLTIGLSTLPTSSSPIQNPWFTKELTFG